jgi:serine/threonine protein kinase/outer membrane biosynthesis protein TonB
LYPRAYGNYVLLERIGTGGMSEIDLARKAVEEASFVRFLVIKRIKADRTEDESFVRMFKDEARISSELHHTNIAQTYDFGRQGDEYYLVLEYVPGVDLRRIVNTARERGQTIPMRVILRIMCEVLDGLQYAHTRLDTFGRPMHIVHRDVNPRNIMVSTRGETKVIDFGVAKAVGRLERTRTDHVKGKFAYMAPEQVAGHDVDHRADIFAVALTLHEMIAGYGPFYGLNHVQIMHRLMSGSLPELPSHPDLPDPSVLRRVQRKALATRPEDRYQDCETYRKDLEKVAERIGGLASRQEVAAFLGTVETDLEERLRAKVASYAGPLDMAPKQSEISTLEVTPELSGSIRRQFDENPPPMSGSFSGTFGTSTTSRGAVYAGLGVGAVAALIAGLLGVVAVLAIALYVVTSQPWDSVAATPVTTAVVPPAPEGTAEEPAPDAPPVEPKPEEPVTAAKTEVPDPEPKTLPKPEGSPTANPEPQPEPQPEVAPPVTPEPVATETTATTAGTAAPEPPAEVAKGTIQVACKTPGLKVRIDGEATSYVTGDKGFEIQWPVGKHSIQFGDSAAQPFESKKGAISLVKCP